MNVGEVENPSAFDPEKKTANTTPVGEGGSSQESNQARDLDAPIGDDGVNYDVYADEVDNTANNANATEMNFSAEDIRKRQKTEYFVNIKDADKIKREEEKQHAVKEKQILSEMRRAEKEAKKLEKAEAQKRKRGQNFDSAEEENIHKGFVAEERRQKKARAVKRREEKELRAIKKIGSFFKFLWRGWHKIPTLAVITAAIVGLVCYGNYLNDYYTNVLPKQEQIRTANKQLDKRYDYTAEITKAIDEAYGTGENDSYLKACSKAEEMIAEAQKEENEEKEFYYTTYYVYYTLSHVPDHEKALRRLGKIEHLAINDIQKAELYNTYMMAYSKANDIKAMEYYGELLAKLSIKENGEGGAIEE